MRAGQILVVGMVMLAAAAPARADDASAAGDKAEIQLLKARLDKLERKMADQAAAGDLHGASSIGEKIGPALVELPSGLQGLGISGYVDTSYIYNFGEADPNSTTNVGRVFDLDSNGFTPQAAELVFEKPMTDAMPIGFRTDLFFGDDAELIHSAGLGATTDNFDLQQAYITVKAPIGDGLDFKVGKFVTLLGAEVIESPANWNFSRSYLFGYAIPFTHTGALATYPLGEAGSATLGVVNGWDIVDDTNKAKSVLTNLTLTPMEGVTLAGNLIHGAERTNDSRNKRTVLDLVGTWQPTEELTLMANYDFGHESGLAQGTASTKGFEAAEWTGLALYAKYDLSPTWALATRAEWFDDRDAVRIRATTQGGFTPLDVDFYEWTLTSQWKLHEHVLARLEYRHDKADEAVFRMDEGFADYQNTIAGEMIYHF